MKRLIAGFLCIVFVILLAGCRNSGKNAERVIGYPALYGEDLTNKAFDVVEKEFAEKYKG